MTPVGRERGEERAVRDHVDQARNAAREAVDESHRGPREEVPDLPAARDRDPVSYVGRRLGVPEGPDVPAKRDSLVQLDEPGMQQEGTELGLPDEDDAEELLGRRLEVREKTELLQRLDR